MPPLQRKRHANTGAKRRITHRVGGPVSPPGLTTNETDSDADSEPDSDSDADPDSDPDPDSDADSAETLLAEVSGSAGAGAEDRT